MEAALYKDFKTSRGINYHYFLSKAQDKKPTLVFLHGFPSTSLDWKHQVTFFRKEGYGLIVPDLLGYGGTDKPTDVTAYRMILMTKDIVDIMDYEQIAKAIAIGHDWGATLTSKLAVYHSDRFIAFGFLAVGYVAPRSGFDIYAAIKSSNQMTGSDILGYWLFFSEDGADKVIAEHFDSFFSVLFPQDPKLWISDLAPVGALKAYCLADRTAPLPSYITEQDKEERREILLKDGMNGGFCWYKAMVQKITPADEANIPEDKIVLRHPVFFGAALQDYVARADLMKASVRKLCPNSTIVDFDTGHWVQLAAPDKTNDELLKWIKGL